MPVDVVAVFDIGKTNKKFLLFNEELHLVHQQEVVYEEITDEDGFACDDIDKLESWMDSCMTEMLKQDSFRIKGVNIATYGATLVYLDSEGKRITPAYNYLKPMPEDVLSGFYERYGGQEEFCRVTASPSLGMLNSGLQILWLKKKKPAVYNKVKTVLHFPQYLSYRLHRQVASEYTSLGCHTAMWDFDNHHYHQWLADEGISLPDPQSNDRVFETITSGVRISTGIGIHDSSSSLVPYFKGTQDEFILISTGTWCIFMNPFNNEPLTAEQLRKDTLCYMSIQQKQVKSSRLFLGHIHDVNVGRLNRHFGTANDFYKTIKARENKISGLLLQKERYFFRNGIPADYLDTSSLNGFLTFDEAYHRFMADLMDLAIESLNLIIPRNDNTRLVYISGGFARNELFTHLLTARLPGKKVCTTQVDNATALGAAMVIYEKAFGKQMMR
jgi:sugar (pentulose or hexulose) kinase